MEAKDIQVEYTPANKKVAKIYQGKIRLQMPAELEDTIWLTPREARTLARRLVEAAKGRK